MSSGPWVNAGAAWPKLWSDGPGHWVNDALCAEVDTELFFPEKGGSSAPAKLICRRCPVIAQCLAFALKNKPEGIWGGTSERQRRDMRAGRSA